MKDGTLVVVVVVVMKEEIIWGRYTRGSEVIPLSLLYHSQSHYLYIYVSGECVVYQEEKVEKERV